MSASGVEISTDRNRLDLAYIHRYLSEECYWALGRSLDIVEKSIANSFCFGVYAGDQQIGFGRVVTDYATFAWLCDVFIDDAHRGQGLGKRLVETVMAHPELQGLRNMLRPLVAHCHGADRPECPIIEGLSGRSLVQ